MNFGGRVLKKDNIFKKFLVGGLALCMLISTSTIALGHSGRTDSSGGHRDNKNKSGLGSYHYHCGGYPAHLHSNGGCPYSSSNNTNNTNTNSVDTITVNNSPTELIIGNSYSLDYKVSYANSTGSCTVSSSNSEVVSVDNNGTMMAKGVGEATITIATKNNTKSFYVSVLPIKVESIDLSDTELRVQLDKEKSVSVTINPYNATNKSVVWTSENENIAQVDEYGNIKAISSGNTIINVNSADGISNSISVEVFEVFPESIDIESEDLRVEIIENRTVGASVFPPDANNKYLKYEVEDPTILEVDESGNIKPIKLGKTNLKITTSNNIEKLISVEVYKIQSESISINKEKEKFIFGNCIDIGEKFNIDADIVPTNATYSILQWTTSDETVVAIEENGEFMAKGIGEAILEVSNEEGISTQVSVRVIDKDKLYKIIFILSLLGMGGVTYIFILKKKSIKLKE